MQSEEAAGWLAPALARVGGLWGAPEGGRSDASPSLIMTSPAGDAQVHLVLQFVTNSPLRRQQDCAEALDKANNFRQDKNRLGFYPTRIYLCEASKVQ